MEFLVYGHEKCPTTGREHLQGFVVFSKRVSLSACKKIDREAHWESAKGSVDDNVRYCTKDGVSRQFGTVPAEQWASGGEARKKQYEEAVQEARNGNFEKIEPSILLHTYSNIKRIRADYLLSKRVERLLEGSICGLWLYAPPGLGKSHFARQYCLDKEVEFYNKPLNKWWDGYDNEPVILVEDIDNFAAKHLGHSLKIWADLYPFIAEYKGGSIKIRPRAIICTSNYPISELWADDVILQEAIKRRFHCPELIRREDFEGIVWNLPIQHGIQEKENCPSSSSTEISSQKGRRSPCSACASSSEC